MENFKFIVFSMLVLGLVVAGGYWAFSSMESGSAHVNNQKIKELEQENKALLKEVDSLKEKIALLEPEEEKQNEDSQAPENLTKETTKEIPTTQTTVSKYQSLIDKLQKVLDSNILLKNKSQGPMVGSVQEFLNIYNKTSNKIDNDYGVSVETAVRNFQKAEGVTASGQVGPNTLKKMLAWLKSH